MVLAIGFVLTACEGPAGPAGGGIPGDSYFGPCVLTGPNVTAADLKAAFDNTTRAVIPGNVTLTSSVETVEGIVPAGRKLIALPTELAVGQSPTATLVIEGELELGEGAQLDATGNVLGGTGGTISFGAEGTAVLKSGSTLIVDDPALLDQSKVFVAPGATNATAAIGASAGNVVTALGTAGSVAVNDLTIDNTNSSQIAAALQESGKTLALVGTIAVSDDFNLSDALGVVIINGTATLGAKTLTGATGAGAEPNIFVRGTLVLDETASLLAGKINVSGTVELDAVPAAPIPASVTFNEGSIFDLAGETMAGSGTIAADLNLATLTDSTGGGTALFADGEVSIKTVATDGNDFTISGSSVTLDIWGGITGAGTVSLGSGVTLALDEFSPLLDDEATISGGWGSYGADAAAAIANINKLLGGTVEVSDAVSLGSNAEFTRADAIEFGGEFETTGSATVSFAGDVTFGGAVTLVGATNTFGGSVFFDDELTLTNNAGNSTTLSVACDEITFAASDGKLLSWLKPLNFALGRDTVLTLPDVEDAENPSFGQGAGDPLVTFTGGTVQRRTDWGMSSNFTFDGAALVITGEISKESGNDVAGPVITVKNGGSLNVGEYAEGFTNHGPVLKAGGADGIGFVITGTKYGALITGSVDLDIGDGTDTTSGLEGGSEKGLILGNIEEETDGNVLTLSGSFNVEAGMVLATTGYTDKPAFTYLPTSTSIDFTLDGKFYIATDGHVIFENTDDNGANTATAPTGGVHIGGGSTGLFLYNNVGNQPFTRVAESGVTAVYLTTKNNASVQFAEAKGWTGAFFIVQKGNQGASVEVIDHCLRCSRSFKWSSSSSYSSALSARCRSRYASRVSPVSLYNPRKERQPLAAIAGAAASDTVALGLAALKMMTTSASPVGISCGARKSKYTRRSAGMLIVCCSVMDTAYHKTADSEQW
jgi:hypothetical protein